MFDIAAVRQQFPALQRRHHGRTPIFFDGPAGTQVPQRVIDAVVGYFTNCNANHGGVFATSRESDRVVAAAHAAVADLLNARSADEIVFGPNMTTLTLHLSRALGRTWHAGDEVLVTRLDHDANVTPWVLAARDAGATVRHVDIHPEDCTLNLGDFRRQLSDKTKLVAIACASNGVGTINDVGLLTRLAHEAGALVFVDAVHYAPHGPIDVQQLGCDFLACSAYKFFGPHIGILWAKREHLERLPAYKLRPVPEHLPDRWMTGTQNHECLAGVGACIDYLAEIGQGCPEFGEPFASLPERRRQLRACMVAIQAYESDLGKHLLEGLARRPRFRVWGITDPKNLKQRVPTVSITMSDRPASAIAEHLAGQHINVWSGNMYAIELTERLGLEQHGGLCRIGLIHYNTQTEVDRLLEALDEL